MDAYKKICYISDMSTEKLVNSLIKKFNVEPIVNKYKLTPVLETWVSVRGNCKEITPFPDVGIRFYLEKSNVCIGMLHIATETMRCSHEIKKPDGTLSLGCMPWEMDICDTVETFDKSIETNIQAHKSYLATIGKYKLYKVVLNNVNYDTYDSAVIACTDKVTLENLLNTRFRRSTFMSYDDSTDEVRFDQDFHIETSQKVYSIEEIGVYDNPVADCYVAVVVVSSFNAG